MFKKSLTKLATAWNLLQVVVHVKFWLLRVALYFQVQWKCAFSLTESSFRVVHCPLLSTYIVGQLMPGAPFSYLAILILEEYKLDTKSEFIEIKNVWEQQPDMHE